MPPPPGAPIAPYIITVSGVTLSGVGDVTGTQFTFDNVTKSTQFIISSSESDSNISVNLASIGDWDDGDTVTVQADYITYSDTQTLTIDITVNPGGETISFALSADEPHTAGKDIGSTREAFWLEQIVTGLQE